MKWPRLPRGEAAAVLATTLLLAPTPASAMLRCKEMVVDNHKFDFGELAGPHTITTSEFHPPTYTNTTYTLDLCAFLKRKGDVKKDEDCPNGTRVCAIRHNIDPRKDGKEADDITHVIPIAGSLLDHGGKAFEWGAERLRTSELPSDADKEGVRLTLRGGMYEAREQRAVVELLCDKDRTGLEGEWESSDEYVPEPPAGDDDEDDSGDTPDAGDDSSSGGAERLMRSVVGIGATDGDKARADYKGYAEKQLKKADTALLWDGYARSTDSNLDVLRLTWYTKHACENGAELSDSGDHWGFFTWMIILIFLATAAYLIFGSWLNYYRYGARGWDLLPHGDTIRDLPYLLKDWSRRFLNTMQGSGSRGGYAAV